MRFLDRIRKRSTGWESLIEMAGKGRDGKIGIKDYKNQVDQYFGTAYACIRKIAPAVASVPLGLYKIDSRPVSVRTKAINNQTRDYLMSLPAIRHRMLGYEDEALVQVTDHPMLSLLYQVNDRMTRHNLFDMTMTWLELNGNCYWLIMKDANGIPIEIRFLFPQHVTPKYDKKTGKIEQYEYKPERKKIIYPAEDVIQFWYPGPFSNIVGFSPIVAASYPIKSEDKIFQYQYYSFDNMGMPRGLIKVKNRLSKEMFARLKKELDELYQGVKKGNKMALLEGEEIEILQLAAKPEEMAFLEGAKLSREWICNIMGVPLSKFTMESSNRAVAGQGDIDFWRDTIKPKCVMFQEELTESLSPMFDEPLIWAFADPVPEDVRMAVLERKANLTVPYTTTDEERAKAGLPPVPGGNVVYQSATMIPLGTPPPAQVTEDYIQGVMREAIAKALEEIGKHGNGG